MRKLCGFAVAAALVLAPVAQANPAATTASSRLTPLAAAEAPIFAAGGTQLSNGIFFPGTATCNGSDCTGAPYEITQGTDLRFYNLDPATVANAHRIVSKDLKRKTGAPLFASPNVRGPDDALVKTSHLQPGTYGFTCTVHFGMDGLITITE